MANPEHVEIVMQGAGAIAKWRQANPCVQLNLGDAYLWDLDLSKSNLREANLQGARFRDVMLTGVDLSAASLERANLERANLIAADLYGANLRSANSHGADLYLANLRNANLNGADLSRASLNEAHCGGADLRNADLRHASLKLSSLSNANLRNADLSNANLHLADLTKADLGNANISRTTLNGANLANANMSDARMDGTDFHAAILAAANLAGAWCSGAVFADIDLSDVRGLDMVSHSGPSEIGFHTLMRSRGQIAEVFLRGCGLSDDFIAYIPSHFSSSAIDFYSCFISYSHADKAFARRLHDALQGQGIRCWLDEHELVPGDRVYAEVDRGIRLWDKVLLCCSEASLNSWWVDREIVTALKREQELHKERGGHVLKIIPLNLDGHLFKWDGHHAATLTERLAADFRNWKRNHDKFEEQFAKVVKALRADKAVRMPVPKPKL